MFIKGAPGSHYYDSYIRYPNIYSYWYWVPVDFIYRCPIASQRASGVELFSFFLLVLTLNVQEPSYLGLTRSIS